MRFLLIALLFSCGIAKEAQEELGPGAVCSSRSDSNNEVTCVQHGRPYVCVRNGCGPVTCAVWSPGE